MTPVTQQINLTLLDSATLAMLAMLAMFRDTNRIVNGAYVGHNIASSVETQFSWTAEAEL